MGVRTERDCLPAGVERGPEEAVWARNRGTSECDMSLAEEAGEGVEVFEREGLGWWKMERGRGRMVGRRVRAVWGSEASV